MWKGDISHHQRMIYANHLIEHNLISIPSVKDFIEFILWCTNESKSDRNRFGEIKEKKDYIHRLIRKAWIDSNKEISYVWKQTNKKLIEENKIINKNVEYDDLELDFFNIEFNS